METNARRYHGNAPGELDWTDAQRQKRAVAEYLAGLEDEAQVQEDGNSRDGGSGGKSTAARSQVVEGDLAFDAGF